jgi:alkanesulfonate monooxygenase SsuD/methylene tetrahydromethanopterin reductase-like flavin-dependent oxidoreductase (luciferase family)
MAEERLRALKAGAKLNGRAEVSALVDEVLAQRDAVAAQDKALRRIAAIKDQHTWSEDDALEAAEIAAAVVCGTPEGEKHG